MRTTPSHREFPFPLNVLFHVLAEEGEVESLHYGLFERAGESMRDAQRRSTALLLQRFPPPPARLLDVGMGTGGTLARLTALGYEAEGITPDKHQVAMARSRFGKSLPARTVALEAFEASGHYDAIFFQESSQYIESYRLFDRCRALAAPGSRVVVLDEFAARAVDRPGALHRLDQFLAAARAFGFRHEEEVDLSAQAAPTVAWFLERLSRRRDELAADLRVSDAQIDDLIESGKAYRDLYACGDYVYRLLCFWA
ncbi:MAG TPA: methyltransferase domain-containing protein [Thermoanaerobaculia bacterium]|nr:methyltransferase domain-containing protein [Thermoanaerobaculia bacterium]